MADGLPRQMEEETATLALISFPTPDWISELQRVTANQAHSEFVTARGRSSKRVCTAPWPFVEKEQTSDCSLIFLSKQNFTAYLLKPIFIAIV